MRTWRGEEPLNGLQKYRKAECKQEHAVNERREDFCPMPAIGVPRIGVCLVRKLRDNVQRSPPTHM